ncbi:glycosyltransferase [Arcicella rosea]|uniref:UDP:flavonoid glycosyltransferase YjiC (YdhE family) n=1 Tax=Arcicella rosea TaxID=502909 RepID=A0A841EMH3_9BACT|nr:nucleotide disphospho-sugar-binding domain-containing protein [Arcicella rosea]MBB6002213.1 UDP:flavonoid glycosyltransferase YjiC (YdhE family) [Arcicella rosea]
MKENILFITTPIFSHIIPTLEIAKILSSQYNIYYCVHNEPNKKLVEENGHKAFIMNNPRFGNGTDAFLLYDELKNSSNNAISFLAATKFYLKNSLFKRRQMELDKIIFEIKPKAIFIDIFSSTDYIVLYKYRKTISLSFFSPMLSTYELGNFPLVTNGEWNSTTMLPIISEKPNLLTKISNFLVGNNPVFQIKYNYWRQLMFMSNKISVDNPYLMTFKNVKEIFLSPIELEFSSQIIKKNQYYLGLCIDIDRKEKLIDTKFIDEFHKIKNFKYAHSKKILYCSFGTFFSTVEEYKEITNFLFAFIEALKNNSSLIVLISVSDSISKIITQQINIPSNFYFFSNVPQLEVLKLSDIFITHGGLGSIKEAIYFEVPLIVFPLDLNWDQCGNSLKVFYHGIGLRGNLREDEPYQILEKVEEVLKNEIYKQNISKLNEMVKKKYTSQKILNDLDRIIN